MKVHFTGEQRELTDGVAISSLPIVLPTQDANIISLCGALVHLNAQTCSRYQPRTDRCLPSKSVKQQWCRSNRYLCRMQHPSSPGDIGAHTTQPINRTLGMFSPACKNTPARYHSLVKNKNKLILLALTTQRVWWIVYRLPQVGGSELVYVTSFAC